MWKFITIVFSGPAAMPQGVLSLLKLKTMNFTDQVKALLVTGEQ